MQLPGMAEGEEVFFGFAPTPQLNWRANPTATISPATISSLVGFSTAELDAPADTPTALVRRARKHAAVKPELAASFESAAGMPDYIPAEMRAQAWRLAHQMAAGAAIEHPESAAPLQRLAKGALRYARKYAKSQVTRETTKGLIPEEVSGIGAAAEVSEPPSEPPTGTTGTTDKPIRRWRDSRGYVHSPNPPGPECRELPPGPKGGRIWDCGGDVETPERNGDAAQEDVASQQGESVDGDAVAAALHAIEVVRANPTPEGVAELAKLLSTLSGEDMAAVREQAANDTPEAAVVAKAARTRLTQREHWLGLAANAKVDAEKALLMAKDVRSEFHAATGSRVPFGVSMKLAIESLVGAT